MSPILIDIILVAVIVLLCIIGFKRGLMLSIVTAGSSIISIILSFILYPIVSKILRATPIFDALRDTVGQSIEKLTSHLAGSTTTAANVVDAISLPDVMKENILSQISSPGKAETLDNLTNSLSGAIAGLIVDIIAIIVLFIVIKIIIMLLKNLIKAIGSIPVIKQVDRIGGLAFGLLEGVILVTVVAAVFSFFSSNIGAESLIEAIDKSVGSYFTITTLF